MKKHYSNLLILPFLTLLMTPLFKVHKNTSRTIASTEPSTNSNKFDSFISADKEDFLIPNESKSVDDFCNKINDLKTELENEKKTFKTSELTPELVKEQRKKIKILARRIYFAQKELKDQLYKEARESFYNEKAPTPFTSEEEKLDKTLSESTSIANDLISLLENNELHIASFSFKPEISEEPKKEIEEKECCKPQNTILTNQVLDLLKQQQLMMKNMMLMNQQMNQQLLSMQQASFLAPFLSNSIFDNGLVQKSPYTYLTPQPAGNWVYYPNGFVPNQNSIFSEPQIPKSADNNSTISALQQNYVAMNPQSNWQLRPTFDFNLNPLQYQTVIPGNFGIDGLSYNMGNTFNL